MDDVYFATLDELDREEQRRREQLIMLESSFDEKAEGHWRESGRWTDVAIESDDASFGAEGSFELSLTSGAAEPSAELPSAPPAVVAPPAAEELQADAAAGESAGGEKPRATGGTPRASPRHEHKHRHHHHHHHHDHHESGGHGTGRKHHGKHKHKHRDREPGDPVSV